MNLKKKYCLNTLKKKITYAYYSRSYGTKKYLLVYLVASL